MRERDFSDDDIFLGLDVGGTFLKGARIDARGRIQERLHEPIRKDTADDLLGQFEAAVRTLEKVSPARAVGIGLPGIVERKTGAVRSAPNVKVLDGLDEIGRASCRERERGAGGAGQRIE